MSKQDDWAVKKETVSLAAMKEMIVNMRKAKEVYDAAKKESNKLYEEYKAREDQIVAALQEQGLTKFNVPGVGTSSLRHIYKVTVPKDVSSKRKLYKYIEQNYGAEVLDEYRSVNYQSLNAFYKQEAEIAEKEGREFHLPGVEEPTVEVSLQWRKDKDGN